MLIINKNEFNMSDYIKLAENYEIDLTIALNYMFINLDLNNKRIFYSDEISLDHLQFKTNNIYIDLDQPIVELIMNINEIINDFVWGKNKKLTDYHLYCLPYNNLTEEFFEEKLEDLSNIDNILSERDDKINDWITYPIDIIMIISLMKNRNLLKLNSIPVSYLQKYDYMYKYYVYSIKNFKLNSVYIQEYISILELGDKKEIINVNGKAINLRNLVIEKIEDNVDEIFSLISPIKNRILYNQSAKRTKDEHFVAVLKEANKKLIKIERRSSK